MGQICTFYSYKGGVGRSMALANAAVLLTQWGHKVLMVDWDLEAPGLEFYFKDVLDLDAIFQREGVINLLNDIHASNGNASIASAWRELVVEINISEIAAPIHFITAGKRDKSYFREVRAFDLKSVYAKKGGIQIERLRNEWKEEYDFVLIDSRTGITDLGGICTIHLPDILALVFTATHQNLAGIVDVARKAHENRKKLPFDRQALLSLPVLSKFDSSEEFKISQWWLDESARELESLFVNWLPRSIKVRDFLVKTKIPYIPYFSYGEKLPVLEQGMIDPYGLGHAYETLTALLAHKLEYVGDIFENREGFVRNAHKSALRKRQAAKKEFANIFVSYSNEDQKDAKTLYDKLVTAGHNPWTASEDILPGERWEHSIRNSLRNSDLALVCLSKKSISPKGFFLKEFSIALEIQKKMPENEIFIIPVRFDDCDIPDELSAFLAVNLYQKNGFEKLRKAIEKSAVSRTRQ